MTFKRILSVLLATLSVFYATAQQKPGSYDAAWKKIDSLINEKGLPQSALTEVNKLYERAKKENNSPQYIKALIYRMSLQEAKEEEATIKNIQQLEKEIALAKEPARSILQSINATSYWSYYIRHRYRLYNRSETINFNKDDIATWSTDDFHKKISELYLASIKNEKLLQQTKLEPFDPIIIKGNVRHLRPTLYDLLAFRALEYFKNDERNISKPAYAFEIDQPAAFAEAKTFADHRFSTRDSLSLHFKALQLFQRILQFHINDPKPDALVDADILRLEFVNTYGVMENKDSLYKKALEQITAKYPSLPVAAQAWYLLANWYAAKAGTYDPPKNNEYRYAYLQAKEICERVIAQKDSSEGKANCRNLLNNISNKELSLHTEKINVPGQPFRTLVSWRNFTQLHFRLVKMDGKLRERLGQNSWDDAFWKQLVKLPAIKSFAQQLPDAKDYQKHSTEIKIDSLPIGEYALLASVDDDYTLEKNVMAVQFFYVSNIAWINKGHDYFVLHRQTGQPLVRADVQVWYRYYNYNARKWQERKGENIFTDNNGYFRITPSQTSNETNYKLEIKTTGDYLFADDYIYNYRYPQPVQEKEQKTTFLFTDRSIYRPGQILYFKGIVVKKQGEDNSSSIATDLSTTVYLFDANGQKVDSLKLTTNEYGSYSGKFNLPSSLLNGQFRLTDNVTHSSTMISVEEYKRPRFQVEIAQPKGTYRLNDTIQVTGTAKAYAGNNIDGATVTYRVTRKAIMPLWYYGYSRMIWPPYPSEEVEITHGETTTNAKGEFTVSFKAIPDKSIAPKDQPTFYYEVHADVTDIAGETRSGNTQVAVAYQALKLIVNVPDKMHTDSLKKIAVTSTNLNGDFEKTTVTLSIYKLETPDRIFRNRYWQQPDTFVMSKEEYYTLFPYDVYKDENSPAKWPVQSKVAEVTDTTSPGSQLAVGSWQRASGWYKIEAIAKDKYGQEVKDIHYIQLYNKNIVSPLASGSIESHSDTLEPGDKAKYTISTNLDSAFIIHEISKKDDKETRYFLQLNKNSRRFELPVTENDRGGLGVQIAFVKHNRVYSDNIILPVPYTNKELTIAYETFRDKTLPGSEEKWKVKINGYKGEKVAAEMLTAMYDASLDQFKPHKWQKPSLWSHFYNRQNWSGNVCFNQVQSQEKYFRDDVYSHYEKNYDQLTYNNYMFIQTEKEALYGIRRMIPGIAVTTDAAREEVAMAVAPQADGNAAIRLRGKADERSKTNNLVQQGEMYVQGELVKKSEEPESETAAPVQVRKNFNETAFFFPDLHTDADGNIEFSFTMPEAVTQWKWMSLTHTKDLSFGYSEKTIVTQKDLMVQPNAPRFLREGDHMNFSGKIVNLTSEEMTGQVELQLIDPSTNQSVDGWFQNVFPNQYFTAPANQSVGVNFTIQIPFQYNRPVTYRLVARSGNKSDGEEAMLPVVSNRMLVTESLPLPVRGNATKNFRFEKLLQSGQSQTLNHHAVTVEFTSNPAWYAVQALPYLMEYPYDCAEQVFNRYYANALASVIANASPRIKEIFERWKTIDTAALLSNLQKNEELKSVLLQETPWVLQAKSEAEQKKNIALLFDMVRMSNELSAALAKLQNLQSSNGGFVWFKGGPDDRYMTQYILTGIGHLKKLNALPSDDRLNNIIRAAIPYLDNRIKEDYENLLKRNKNQEPPKGGISALEIQYLYMRSFFPEYGVPGNILKAYTYYRKQAQQHWLQQSRYFQGMIALSLFRTGDVKTANDIVASLEENALRSEEMGMYWKDISSGYYWYQAPIESHSLLIETFTEVAKDTKAVDDLKTWLLKQKQTQHWRTTKATADACYALLLQGTQWLTSTPEVTIQLGNEIVRSTDQQQEAGTGYFKKVIDGPQVKPSMGDIKVTVQSNDPKANSPAWGAVYWQYFETLENITPAATPLQLTKKLFVEKNTDRGPVLQPLNEGDVLHVGDKVKVRIELRSDRALEYVHMKDMRAACMEPVNVLSAYKWQGGLGYYETTKDASTNFFFGWLPKGTFVFEYPLFVTHTGTFSNGVTTIQCMYAPEFTSHSEGIKVNVEE